MADDEFLSTAVAHAANDVIPSPVVVLWGVEER
jgi:hypothetical protein